LVRVINLLQPRIQLPENAYLLGGFQQLLAEIGVQSLLKLKLSPKPAELIDEVLRAQLHRHPHKCHGEGDPVLSLLCRSNSGRSAKLDRPKLTSLCWQEVPRAILARADEVDQAVPIGEGVYFVKDILDAH